MKRQNLKKTSGGILFDKSIYEKNKENNPYKRFNIHNARAKVKLIKI